MGPHERKFSRVAGVSKQEEEDMKGGKEGRWERDGFSQVQPWKGFHQKERRAESIFITEFQMAAAGNFLSELPHIRAERGSWVPAFP